jgi:hypothetical protein
MLALTFYENGKISIVYPNKAFTSSCVLFFIPNLLQIRENDMPVPTNIKIEISANNK